jgi:riboflavin synthase
MFTGIVEEAAEVESVRQGKQSILLVLGSSRCASDARVGDSVAVNGCCLTVAKITGRAGLKNLHFDLLRETWERTNLQFVVPGTRVNLERSLSVNGRLGGHFVTGHIEGLGRIIRWGREGTDHLLEISASAGILRYVICKGSIAVDGISLTVAELRKKSFRVWIIPHTYEVTGMCQKQVGDQVNLETDLLAKYVERLLTSAGKI